MPSLLLKYVSLLIVFSSLHFMQAQDVNEAYKQLVNSKVEQKTTTYHELDSIFKLNNRDSLKMKYLNDRATKEGNLLVKGYAQNQLGVIYRNLSQYKKAIYHHNEALSIAKHLKNIPFNVNALNMLGVVYRRQDNIRLALDYHQEALKLAYTTPKTKYLESDIAVSYNSLGNIYLALQQFELALKQFEKSLDIEYKFDNKLGLAINHHNIGYAHEALGHLDVALEYYKKSLDYNNAIKSKVGQVICNISIGSIYLKQNQYRKAYNIIKPVTKLAEEINDQFYISSAYLNLGQAETKLNRLRQAERSLNKGLKAAEDHNLKGNIGEALILLSELNEKKGNYQTALSLYKKGSQIESDITSQKNTQYVNDLTFKYENERNTNRINALANENEIVKLKLQRNHRGLFVAGISALLLAGVFYAYNRQKQLKHEKRIVSLKQDALRNQMNPHFIFNALNSIKLYIISNEQKKAAYYLNKFSKLIRKILDGSSLKETTLAEELETMDLYMSIENIRFSNEIDFTTKVDESIDLETIKVPPLILQPFLENALWHGLSSKKDNKKIWLRVSQTNPNFIDISIEDNGIGRKQAALIKQQKTIKRKSVGLDITKKRLTNFAKDLQNTFALDFYDLYDEYKNPTGTKVNIILPLT